MDATSPARIAGIYRYPVKGLTPEQLSRAELKAGQTLLADRRYAIENGPSGFDPAEPKWLPKPHFLMLMRDEWLAGLRTQFRRREQRPLDQPQRPDRGPGQPRNARGPADDRELLRLGFSRSDQGAAEGAGKSWPQFFGRRPQGRFHHQSRQRPRHREHGGRAGPSASLSRQPLCRGLAGLARIRPRRPHAGDRRCETEGGETHRPLRRRQCRSGYRPARPRHPAGAAAPARPRRLRDLCRGDRRRQRSAPAIRSRRSSRSCCS